MKKTVKFEAFGKDDYLCLDIGKMARMERVTGKAMTNLADLMIEGKFGVDLTMKTLPIALEDCREIEDIEQEMNNALKNGYNITSMAAPLLTAIIETGLFANMGKRQAQKIAQNQAENK